MATAALQRSWRQTLTDHLLVTKPRIILLIVLTTWASMWLAVPDGPDGWLVLATLVGTGLAVAGAHTFNQYLERDIDALMDRTRRRPLVQGRMSPSYALKYGAVLSVASFLVLTLRANVLSAALAQLGLWYYVLVYTSWLKRRTPLNTVIGGVSGAVPPLIGWAAATGKLEPAALLLFLVMVLWQPPHFFALALYRLDDYRRAGVPMLPVVSGVAVTVKQIFWYTLAMVVASITLYWPVRLLGPVYLTVAVLTGAGYITLAAAAVRGAAADVETWGKRLFTYSMFYLAALFVAMVVDRVG